MQAFSLLTHIRRLRTEASIQQTISSASIIFFYHIIFKGNNYSFQSFLLNHLCAINQKANGVISPLSYHWSQRWISFLQAFILWPRLKFTRVPFAGSRVVLNNAATTIPGKLVGSIDDASRPRGLHLAALYWSVLVWPSSSWVIPWTRPDQSINAAVSDDHTKAQLTDHSSSSQPK